MSAHTPGPWKIDSDGSDEERGGAHAIRTDTPQRWGIASVWHQSGGEHDGSSDLANARLIAAAPELLSLLTAMLEEFDESDPTKTTWTGNFPALADEARAAIAKARGPMTTPETDKEKIARLCDYRDRLEREVCRLGGALDLLALRAAHVRSVDQLPEFRTEVMGLLAQIDAVRP